MQPNGRCMELVLLNPTKAADPQIFWMNLHFDGRKQRQFHFTGSTPQRPICSIPAPYIYPRKDSEKWSKRICVGIFCKCKIFGTEDASNRAVQGTDSHWYIWTHIDLDSLYMHQRHKNMINIKRFYSYSDPTRWSQLLLNQLYHHHPIHPPTPTPYSRNWSLDTH